jgi:hypothetical protein
VFNDPPTHPPSRAHPGVGASPRLERRRRDVLDVDEDAKYRRIVA